MTPFYHEGLTLLLDSGHFLPYRKCDLGHTISPGRTHLSVRALLTIVVGVSIPFTFAVVRLDVRRDTFPIYIVEN